MKPFLSLHSIRSLRPPLAVLAAGILPLCGLLVACGDKAPSEPESSAAEIDPRIEALRLDEAPPEPLPVQEARKDPAVGSEIVVVGRVGGVDHPFAETHAMLVIIDDEVETCERIPGDECPTPWDACCEDPDKLKAMRLTVQVNDETGQPLPVGLQGTWGLAELDEIVVVGTVAEGSSEENLVLSATGIFRKEP